MPIAKERILYEDEWLLAVTKLSGELVVKGKGRVDRLPLLDFLKKQYPTLTPIHRLDFETSGVVVFAKTKNTLQSVIHSKFSGWKKRYIAIVLGTPKPAESTIDIPLQARSGTGVVPSSTKYKLIERLGPCSLIECEFERGQRHQIRQHMNMIGHPLILDDVYGQEKANRSFSKALRMHRFFLHATSVDFPHPVSKQMIHIDSPMPKYFEATLAKLRG
jgi:RluA family pseudouridine synthase